MSPDIRCGHRPVFRFRLLLPRYWATWSGILLAGILAFLPERVRAVLADRLVPLLLRYSGKRKRIALVNLSICYPELSDDERSALLARHVRILAHIYLGYGRLMFRSARYLRGLFDIHGLTVVERAVAEGRNIILLTPHTLALEYAAQFLSIEQSMVGVVRLHSDNELLDWVVTRFRTRYHGVVYDSKAGMLSVVRHVRQGRWFYYLPDEDRGSGSAVFSPFFGVPRATLPLLGKVAESCRAVVIPMTAAYCPERRRFSIRFDEPLAGLTGTDKALDSLKQNQAIEHILNRDPAQYMWSDKIFRTRPQGAPGLY